MAERVVRDLSTWRSTSRTGGSTCQPTAALTFCLGFVLRCEIAGASWRLHFIPGLTGELCCQCSIYPSTDMRFGRRNAYYLRISGQSVLPLYVRITLI